MCSLITAGGCPRVYLDQICYSNVIRFSLYATTSVKINKYLNNICASFPKLKIKVTFSSSEAHGCWESFPFFAKTCLDWRRSFGVVLVFHRHHNNGIPQRISLEFIGLEG